MDEPRFQHSTAADNERHARRVAVEQAAERRKLRALRVSEAVVAWAMECTPFACPTCYALALAVLDANASVPEPSLATQQRMAAQEEPRDAD